MELGLATGFFAPITTRRLALRSVAPGDSAALSALMTPEVSRWLASWPVPFHLEMAETRIAADAALMTAGLAWCCCVVRRDDRCVLGWISLSREAADAPLGYLSFWLGEAYQKAGYMREALGAMIDAGLGGWGLQVIEGGAQTDNLASLAVMRSCGMAPAEERMVFAAARGRAALCRFFRIEKAVPR